MDLRQNAEAGNVNKLEQTNRRLCHRRRRRCRCRRLRRCRRRCHVVINQNIKFKLFWWLVSLAYN